MRDKMARSFLTLLLFVGLLLVACTPLDSSGGLFDAHPGGVLSQATLDDGPIQVSEARRAELEPARSSAEPVKAPAPPSAPVQVPVPETPPVVEQEPVASAPPTESPAAATTPPVEPAVPADPPPAGAGESGLEAEPEAVPAAVVEPSAPVVAVEPVDPEPGGTAAAEVPSAEVPEVESPPEEPSERPPLHS